MYCIEFNESANLPYYLFSADEGNKREAKAWDKTTTSTCRGKSTNASREWAAITP